MPILAAELRPGLGDGDVISVGGGADEAVRELELTAVEVCLDVLAGVALVTVAAPKVLEDVKVDAATEALLSDAKKLAALVALLKDCDLSKDLDA